MRVTIVYDRVNKWGGAERVLLALHEIFPEAPLYTSVYDAKRAPWAKVFPKIITSFLQNFPFARLSHEFYAPLMPFVFESFDFTGFDLVISVTSEAAKGIITKPGTKHICYCLTPTRYLWSHYDEYFKDPVFKGLLASFIKHLRSWDKIAAQRPDEMIAISSGVQERIKNYYGRDSKIIFPPANTSLTHTTEVKEGKYYLVVSRLVKYKRIDLAVGAFNELGYPLIVVGKGREEVRLKLTAKKNIRFLGEINDKELSQIYQNAKALIMPQEEDFGIVAVEAQSFGVPVIAYRKGGARDSVIDGKTGIFFDKQSVESLMSAIAKFEKSKFVVDNLYTNAKRFSFEVFKKELSGYV